MRAHVSRWQRSGERVAFVPTMGNLHAGHVSLIDLARRHGQRFVASIFVNPMQFGPNEDFAHYPRTPDADQKMLAAAGCDLMFMPDVAEIYPTGAADSTRIEIAHLSRILEGEYRPGHFEGVTTVVAKLFNIVEPQVAVFGEKDFQQLTVIRQMVADLCLPIEIVSAPTVRERDGLAMSSRNQYLTPAERQLAPRIFAALERARQRLLARDPDLEDIEREGIEALAAAGLRTDYFSIRDARNLSQPRESASDLVVLTAVRMGRARLIDNVQVRRPVP